MPRTLVAAGLPVGVALLAAAAIPPILAQDQQPPVFRAGTTLVYVDAYPWRDGRLIEGLSSGDFQVFEDGKPQRIESFEFIRFESNPYDGDRRDPTSIADSERQAADPRNRVFVIYLDLFHTTRNGSRDGRQPLLDFVHRTIGARDLFGVMTPYTPVSTLTFGRRTETLEAELSLNYGAWGLQDELQPAFPRTRGEERIVSCALSSGVDANSLLRRFREDLFYTSLEGLVVRLRDLREERKNVLLLTEGWVPSGRTQSFGGRGSSPGSAVPPIGGRFGLGPQALPPIGIGRGGPRSGPLEGRDLGSSMSDRAWCNAEAARLAQIEFDRRFRELVTSARDANVTFFPINLGGLKVGGHTADRQGPIGRPFAGVIAGVEVLRTLAENTDGWAFVNNNDIPAGFERVSERLAAYYLLVYYSTNPEYDGKFRKIDVKVNGPGVSLTARRGYMARPPIVRASTVVSPGSASPVLDDVSAELGGLVRLTGAQEVFGRGAVHPDVLEITAELASREIGRGRWAKGADVTITVTDGSGSAVDGAERIQPGSRGAIVRVPRGPGQAGPWRIRMRVTGDQGVVEDRFELGLSSDKLLGQPMVFRAASPPRAPLHPVAELLFRRSERLRVEWPVLQPLEERTARLLDRRGQPLAPITTLTDRTLPDGASIVALDLALASLTDGDYVIDMSARRGMDVERKLLAFRLAR